MDKESCLILIKNEDKTEQVVSYEDTNSRIRVMYRNNPKAYSYSAKDVTVLKNPVVIRITDKKAVFHNGISLPDVKRVLDFGANVRVFFADDKTEIFEKNQIRIESSGVQIVEAYKIMDYWRTISEHVKGEEDQPDIDAFLMRQFAKLSVIHPGSVLSHYINKRPIVADNEVNTTPIFPFRYNLSQKTALDQAMHHAISVVEGPPGTGKTQTILNILANLAVMQNKKVAVVSGNNAAVQNVRDKLEAEGYHFFVAPLGNRENKEVFFTNLPDWDVSEWKSDLSELKQLEKVRKLDSRISQLMELDREKAQLQQKLSAYLLEQKHFEHYYEKQDVRKIGKLSFYRQTPDRILEFMKDSFLAVEKGKEDSLFYKFKLLVKHGFTDFKRLKEQEVEIIVNFQQQFYVLKVKELSKRVAAIEEELQAQSYLDLLKQHQHDSVQLFRHRLHEKYHNRSKIECNEKTYMHAKNFDSFIDHYPIVLSTTHSLRNCVPADFLFDYVIIDESSQVDLLTGALALSCCKRAIIVGDTKQLPQIVDVKIEESIGSTESVGIHKAYNYFQQNLLSSVLTLYGDAVPKVVLREHYRCHPQIIEFCNQKYYDGELITFTSAVGETSPLLIYRTELGNHMREVTRGAKKGKFNQRELDVIEQEVLLGLEEAAAGHSDIGFVTPYRKQVDKASHQLADDIESDTIHKYQGREKPIMIMSTVLDQSRSGKIGMKFVNDPCKINVAVSRAQKKFILVTDQALFRTYGNEIGDLTRYMEYSTLDQVIMDSEIVSVFDLLYKEYSEKLRSFRERVRGVQVSRFMSENMMQALLEDILQEPAYSGFELGNQMLLLNLFGDLTRLEEHERLYIQHQSSVDFVIYHKLDKSLAFAIEVDGFAFHENNPEQLKRDELKGIIFEKYGHKLQRLSTTGSNEEQKIRGWLDSIL
ncbi:MAG: AAA family ATPase [Gorillibacterium sp.]|nr:AAA family ATPase [Gorillibacterium sp.]